MSKSSRSTEGVLSVKSTFFYRYDMNKSFIFAINEKFIIFFFFLLLNSQRLLVSSWKRFVWVYFKSFFD